MSPVGITSSVAVPRAIPRYLQTVQGDLQGELLRLLKETSSAPVGEVNRDLLADCNRLAQAGTRDDASLWTGPRSAAIVRPGGHAGQRPGLSRVLREPSASLGDALDDVDQLVTAIPAFAGESDEFASAHDDGAAVGDLADGDAPATAEVEEALVAQRSQRAKDGVGVDAEHGSEVAGGRQALTRFGFTVGDRAAELCGDLLMEARWRARKRRLIYAIAAATLLLIVAAGLVLGDGSGGVFDQPTALPAIASA